MHLAALEEGSLILRDEHGYLEWEENGLTPLYAYWQLVSAAGLDETLSGRSPLVMLAGGTQQLSEHLAGRAEVLRDPEYPSRIAAGHREFELLLTRTQSLFMPLIRGSYRREAIFDRRGETIGQDTEQWAMEQLSCFDYAEAAEQCSVTAEDLKQHHDALLMEIDRSDPLKKWRDLVDRVDRRKIEALTGDVRITQDLHDAAAVLRRWHRSLIGEGNLLEEWDESRHFGPSRRAVNKARYGFEELRANRAALPGILDHFGIYPWKVMLITEGKGDVAMLEAIVSHHTMGRTLAELGIVPHVMGGSPSTRDQGVRDLLGALWRFPNFFFLVFDDEGTAAEWITELERFKPDHAPFEGIPLLEPEPDRARDDQPPEGWSGDSYFPKRRPGTEVWRQDIEADNFSPEEICEVISQMAASDDRIADFDLPAEELSAAHSRSHKGIAEVAKKLAEDRAFPFSKVDLDRDLGHYAVTHRQGPDGSDRRVLIVAEHLYRLTVAHRQLRGRLREHERETLQTRSSSLQDEASSRDADNPDRRSETHG